MRTTKLRIILACILIVVAGSRFTIRAQMEAAAAQDDGVELELVEPGAVPSDGTFFSLQYPDGGPMPLNWLSDWNVPVYSLPGRNWFWVDDRSFDYSVFDESKQSETATDGPMSFDGTDGSGGGDSGGPMGPNGADYGSNTLWLSIEAVTNNQSHLTVHGTVSGTHYEILSKESLTSNLTWFSEGIVPGASNQDWTPTTVAVFNRTNALFFSARNISLDTTGQGIPDWWQILHFGYAGIDPAADPDGDGWNNLEEFLNNTDPVVPDLPPAPRNARAVLDSTGTNIFLTWAYGGGTVIQYGILAGDAYLPDSQFAEIGQVNVNTFNFVATSGEFLGTTYLPPQYKIRAYFPNGVYVDTPRLEVEQRRFRLDVKVVRGPAGQLYLAAGAPPMNLSHIHLFFEAFDGSGNLIFPGFDVHATNLANGLVLLSKNEMEAYLGYSLWAQAFLQDRTPAEVAYVPPGMDETAETPPQLNFINASSNITENLKFLLRSATKTRPFSYTSNRGIHPWDDTPSAEEWFMEYPEIWFARLSSPTNYEYYGYRFFSSNLNYSVMQELRPVQENYLWRNFVFDSADYANEYLDTGAGSDPVKQFRTLTEPKYEYFGSGAETNLPLAFTAGNSSWFYFREFNSLFSLDWDPEIGVYLNSSTNLILNAGERNCYGLPLNSLRVGASQLVYPGNVFGGSSEHFFPAFDVPTLVSLGYYFVSQTPYFQAGFGPPPMPGSPSFNVTNTSPLLIAAVGQPIAVSSWVRKVVLNNYPSERPAYLEQYFANAYRMNTNGVATSDVTGLLSPYGEFFPTEPGPAALVTMPEIEAGGQGTGIVHVIAFSTDANHDGVIDSTFGGPDYTSEFRPFRFWVNDDDDKGDVEGSDIPGYPAAYRTGDPNGSDGVVNGVRDLVDFFPVCLKIQSLLQALPATPDITVWLKQADSAVNYIDPSAYAPFAGFVSTNCLAYLTDTNIARALGGSPGPFVIPGAATYQLTDLGSPLDSAFVNSIRNGGPAMILVEARGPTKQPLVLEVHQGSTVIARTQLYLSISKVEDMYREKNLIREVWTNSIAGFKDRLADSDVPNEPDHNGKNFVFLHGYNVNPNQARGWSAEIFKRMYWSGSHAKFYGVTWHGSESQPLGFGKITPNLQTNIVNAFMTAPKLADFLATLTNQTVVAAHSLGNMVVLSALNECDARIDKFFMIDAAVAMEAIDGGATASTNMIHSDWIGYAERLWAGYWCRLFPTNDGRSTLTWSNRFANLPITNIYNFYSSGEEVLRTHTGLTPDFVGYSSIQLVNYLLFSTPTSVHAWALQEKLKGRSPLNGVMSSFHGGWKFNDTSYGTTFGGQTFHMPTNEAALLSDSQLRTNAFFEVIGPGFSDDTTLFGPNGSAYAQANRNRILTDAIPALTLPVAANPVLTFSPQGQPPRNFNMNALYQNGWPISRLQTEEINNWWHSDLQDVAYTYVYPLFDQFVTVGDLK